MPYALRLKAGGYRGCRNPRPGSDYGKGGNSGQFPSDVTEPNTTWKSLEYVPSPFTKAGEIRAGVFPLSSPKGKCDTLLLALYLRCREEEPGFRSQGF